MLVDEWVSSEDAVSVRRVLLIIATLLGVLFVSQNLDSVEVSLLLGRPIEAPLALVIGASFVAGFLAGLAIVLERRFRREQRKNDEDQDYLPG